AMDTYGMGRVTVDAHTFFMGMYANQVNLVSIERGDEGSLVARLTGNLSCATEAGSGSITVGSRQATEPAAFEIEAVDGGPGGGAGGDRFTFIVFFDPDDAPVNHTIFGPKAVFTGDMVVGEITIGPP